LLKDNHKVIPLSAIEKLITEISTYKTRSNSSILKWTDYDMSFTIKATILNVLGLLQEQARTKD